MERIKTIATRDLTKRVVTASCGVANQKCENSNK